MCIFLLMLRPAESGGEVGCEGWCICMFTAIRRTVVGRVRGAAVYILGCYVVMSAGGVVMRSCGVCERVSMDGRRKEESGRLAWEGLRICMQEKERCGWLFCAVWRGWRQCKAGVFGVNGA